MDFSQLATLLGAAAAAGIVAKLLRQPLIIGFLFAGYILASLGVIKDGTDLEALSKIGVTLLLFLVGLEMNLSELPSIGKVALVTGLGQIIFTSTIGFLIANLLGFGLLPALYIAVALTFSSTIIIVKLLSLKNDLGSLYGRISVGFLLVQDLVAVLILMFLASLGKEGVGPNYFYISLKGIALILATWFLSKKVLPLLFTRIIDQSTELVFIVGIAWALVVAAFVGGPLGFSLEIGGFLAGIALSNLPDHLQIAARTRPLRDFFLTLFFLFLGTNLLVENVGSVIIPALFFSAFVLIGNPLIILIIMGLLGYKKRTSFLASVTVAQISEFSLILMAMGLSLGHVGEKEVAIVVLVGVVTMTLSTYLILGADKIYLKLIRILSLFERKNSREEDFKSPSPRKNHIVLVGAHRTGMPLVSFLKKRNEEFNVIEFNPDIAANLANKEVPVVFGDISDEEVLAAANVSDAKLVVSTTSDIHDNLSLLSFVNSFNNRPYTILKASNYKDAITLYSKGASYVIVPEVVAGEHIRHILKDYGFNKRLLSLGKAHAKRLQKEKS